jgi:hypothetical protein
VLKYLASMSSTRFVVTWPRAGSASEPTGAGSARERVGRPPPLGRDASPVRAVAHVQATVAVVPVRHAAAMGGRARLKLPVREPEPSEEFRPELQVGEADVHKLCGDAGPEGRRRQWLGERCVTVAQHDPLALERRMRQLAEFVERPPRDGAPGQRGHLDAEHPSDCSTKRVRHDVRALHQNLVGSHTAERRPGRKPAQCLASEAGPPVNRDGVADCQGRAVGSASGVGAGVGVGVGVGVDITLPIRRFRGRGR